MTEQLGGWAGKVLRVNLTTGVIHVEPTSQYHPYIGGMGIGYKVLWDGHVDDILATDEENKLVISAGPLTGSGAICTGRTTITSRSPVIRGDLITDGHFGGHFSPALKFAGYDAVVFEGKAAEPVWLRIEDDDVRLESAAAIWGKGMHDTFAWVAKTMGQSAQVAAIGPAGEHLVAQSTIQTQGGHSAGGHGAVLGSKNLKAIGVIGTGGVGVAAGNEALRQLDDHVLGIIGANNQGVVPNQPQSWAEYSSSGSRWRGGPGVQWGAADEPVDIGETPWDDKAKVGMRTSMAEMYFGREEANKHFRRAGGCHACPIRCFCEMKNPKMKSKYGLPTEHVTNVCLGFLDPWYAMGKPGHSPKRTDIQTVGGYLMDDLGVWSAYGQMSHVFREFHKRDFWREILPVAEFEAIAWQQVNDQDAHFMAFFYTTLAHGNGVLGKFLGCGLYQVVDFWHGPEPVSEADYRLDLGQDLAFMVALHQKLNALTFALDNDLADLKGQPYSLFKDKACNIFNQSMVGGLHHASETAAQVGALINTTFNRDAQCHSHINLVNCGLPQGMIETIAAELWGEGAFDKVKHYTPINAAKIAFAKWSLVKNVLHDSLTLCNWMFPLVVSPDKNRDYRGDSTIEAQMFTLVTGRQTSEAELDHMAERVLHLHRALTVLQMKQMDQRHHHDVLTPWVYDMDPDKAFGDEGTIKMDRDDMQKSLDLFYAAFGWDVATGAPTRATLERFELGFVADTLEARGLLPG
ncbi:aldehyde ferredoxin oxidoreductase [Halomonas denitrificans]|nr:aldehyde ferredoxin oxidoreductase [Halomonas denitrificans]